MTKQEKQKYRIGKAHTMFFDLASKFRYCQGIKK